MGAYKVIQIDDSTWAIDEGMVKCYLLAGKERALLIDTGNGVGDLKALVSSLTDRPVMLVNTHADGDHTGCNDQFDTPYLHPSEFSYFEERNPGKAHLALPDNARVYLGERWIEVLLIPGHTCGSIALLDEERKYLFSGDMVSESPIFMFGAQRSMLAYYASLERLTRQAEFFDQIFPAHGPMPLKPEIIQRLKDCCEAALAGRLEAQEPPFPLPAKLYSQDGVGFLLK
jgi:glyoxylase-like metal-dependent hydrolase (beta-lactamase superfamily II)